ncbi:MAG: hypothetical protein GEV06_03625 [Luteitalea sp.]|nr:hypothetical protein [Luteitalea sp.]
MLLLLEFLTVCWLGASALAAARRLALGYRDTILFVFPLHFLLTGLPLVWDMIFGVPTYQRFPGFHLAATDPTARFAYCLTVSVPPLLWWAFRRPLRPASHRGAGSKRSEVMRWIANLSPAVRLTAILVLVLPVLLVLVSPDPSVYLRYTPWWRGWADVEATRQFHFWIARSVQFSFVAAALLLLHAKRLGRALLVVVPFVAAAAWIPGKRNAVAFAAAFLLYALWERGVLRGRRLVIVTAVAAIVFGFFSVIYQTQLRFPEEYTRSRTVEDWIENARVDFGRDDVIRLVIHSELDPGQPQILDYPGESYLVVLGAILRGERIEAPSYPNRLTSIAMRSPPGGSGGVTTSILDESIANFGWIGLLVAPLVVLVVCRLGDSCHDSVISALTLFVVVCMFTTHPPPWAIMALVWTALVCHAKLFGPTHTPAMVPPPPLARRTIRQRVLIPRHAHGVQARHWHLRSTRAPRRELVR